MCRSMLGDYIDRLAVDPGAANPLFGFLGIEIVEMSAEEVVLRLPLKNEFHQGAGVVAGGVLSSLADEAMAHVAVHNLVEGEGTATIEMNLRFVRPITKGVATARAKLVKKGKSVITLSADVTDDKDRLVAQAGASFMIIRS